jgi:hypothetical protein
MESCLRTDYCQDSCCQEEVVWRCVATFSKIKLEIMGPTYKMFLLHDYACILSTCYVWETMEECAHSCWTLGGNWYGIDPQFLPRLFWLTSLHNKHRFHFARFSCRTQQLSLLWTRADRQRHLVVGTGIWPSSHQNPMQLTNPWSATYTGRRKPTFGHR